MPHKKKLKYDPSAIVRLREKMDLSQAELGKRMGRTNITIFHWEHGNTYPKIESLVAMCNRFDVPITFFFKEE
jgi:transcriptional regulator with XRE-family HTH domain